MQQTLPKKQEIKLITPQHTHGAKSNVKVTNRKHRINKRGPQIKQKLRQLVTKL